MTPSVRRLALTLHVIVSVGLLGAVSVFLVLAVVGLASNDGELVRTAYLACRLATWDVIVPAASAALLSGVVSSLGTPWGLFRYYWVVIKLALTVFAVAVLLVQTGTIDAMAEMAARGPIEAGAMFAQRAALVLHALGGVAVLVVATVLSIYKPRGMTRYGAARMAA